jgi:predicted DCC family thiol-disulfide oxidoreductase YuxK
MFRELLIALKTYQFPFLWVLAFSLVLVRFVDVSPALARIHGFLVRRGFSVNHDLDREITRLEIVRIATGLVLCHRTLLTLLYMPWSATSGLEWMTAGGVMVLAIAFTAGFFTPVAGLALFLVMQPFDRFLRTNTLGTDVLQMILLILAFVPAGTALSLDAVLRSRRGRAGRILESLYARFGVPTIERISVLRFLALLSYGMLCIYSVLFHLTDPAWMQGYANALLLSSSYLSRHYEVFREVFTEFPGLGLRLAHATLIGMMLWEALLLPLVFLHRLTRALVVIWGILFFCVSLMLLQLGWLAYYEFIFWAALFWQARWLNAGDRAGVKLLYDDRCNLCDRTVRFLSRVDLFRVIRFHPLSRSRALLEQHGIDTNEALRDLYGIDEANGRFYKGYALYTMLSARLLLLVPAWPVLVAGRLAGLGPAIYSWIAQRRIRMFGVCELPAPLPSRDPILPKRGSDDPARAGRLFAALCVSYGIFLVIFTARLPHIESIPPLSYVNKHMKRYFKEAYETVGLAPINVFNAADLRMSEVFLVMERRDEEGEWDLLPFTGLHGQRLDWHESDRVYFGNSLAFRRRGRDNTCLHDWQLTLIRERIAINEHRSEVTDGIYRLRYFRQPLPDTNALLQYQFTYPGIEQTCEVEYVAGTDQVTRIDRLPAQAPVDGQPGAR